MISTLPAPIYRRQQGNARRRWAERLVPPSAGGEQAMAFITPGSYDNTSRASINAYHNARNPGSGIPYDINPNLWCLGLRNQLTGVSFYKDDCGTGWGAAGTLWRHRYGSVAVTKRHIIHCGHAMSHAAGTWGLNLGQTNPTRIRFIDINGYAVDRVQIHQASALRGSVQNPNYNEANMNGLHSFDVGIAVLDEDLPDSIHIMRVTPEWSRRLSAPTEGFGFCQEYEPNSIHERFRFGSEEYFNSAGYQYRYRNLAMFYMWSGFGFPNHRAYSYWPWGGDSGMPTFTILPGSDEVIFVGFPGAGGHSLNHGSGVPGWTMIDVVNALIRVADDRAIAMGRLAQRTNYTVNVSPDPTL